MSREKNKKRAVTLSGRIVRGAGRGRKFGFPTANIALDAGIVFPSFGVYAGEIIVDGEKFLCAVSVGVNETVGAAEKTIEAYMFNFGKNIYNKKITLTLDEKIREMQRFHSVTDLKKAIEKDVAYIKERYQESGIKNA